MHCRQVVVQSPTGISGASLLPSLHVRHMEVEVPHMGERVASRWTSSNPTIIRTFPVRAVRTIPFVLPPCLFNLICLPTEWTNIPTLGDCCVCTMFSMVVLTHDESTGILLPADRACHPGYLAHKPLCALSMSFW